MQVGVVTSRDLQLTLAVNSRCPVLGSALRYGAGLAATQPASVRYPLYTGAARLARSPHAAASAPSGIVTVHGPAFVVYIRPRLNSRSVPVMINHRIRLCKKDNRTIPLHFEITYAVALCSLDAKVGKISEQNIKGKQNIKKQ